MSRRLVAVLSCALVAGAGAAPGRPASTLGARHAAPIRLSVLRLVDHSRTAVFRNGTSGPRTLVTDVRYPAGGRRPLPLIVFAHGFALLPGTYTRLLDAWTRAGYVVAAPAFPVENALAPGGPDESDLDNQPADISFVITQLVRADHDPRSPLHGLIDPSRIAVAGHSDGGETAFAAAYERHYLDPRIRAAIILSGALLQPDALLPRRHSPPLLAIQGDADPVNAPAATLELFRDAAAPKYMLTLLGAGHLAPYTSNSRQLAVVERVTTAFLAHYLKKAPLHALLDAARAPGVARLTSDP